MSTSIGVVRTSGFRGDLGATLHQATWYCGMGCVLPEIWQSIFYHAKLDLLLVVYVDDFKMAGPEANSAEGWKRISSVIDRTEDYWEVDPEVGAVIRHHIYPRKKLYVPTEDDIIQYPTLQPIRVTEPEDDDSTLDDPNQNPRGMKDKWWTGQTCFPLIEVDPEEFRLALAARKGPTKRSKAEAKLKLSAKQGRANSTVLKAFRTSLLHACPSLST